MDKSTRRDLILRGIELVSAISLLPMAARGQGTGLACVQTDSEPLRESLNYVDPSPDPKRSCSGCGFFEPNGNASCGNCMIMTGPTNATAYCESWSEPS